MRRLLLAVAVLVAAAALAPAPAAAWSDGPEVVAGPSSVFGGRCDLADNDNPAYPTPATRAAQRARQSPNEHVPGIAMLRGDTARRWFVVAVRGRRVIAQHLDYGPAAWTGKVIDVNALAAWRLGYQRADWCLQYVYPTWTWARATQIAPGLRWPSCSWAARMVVHRLRDHGPIGAGGSCLSGRRAAALQRFQRAHHRPRTAARRVVDLQTWRLLLRAR